MGIFAGNSIYNDGGAGGGGSLDLNKWEDITSDVNFFIPSIFDEKKFLYNDKLKICDFVVKAHVNNPISNTHTFSDAFAIHGLKYECNHKFLIPCVCYTVAASNYQMDTNSTVFLMNNDGNDYPSPDSSGAEYPYTYNPGCVFSLIINVTSNSPGFYGYRAAGRFYLNKKV